MGFTTDGDGDGNGKMPNLEAVIVDIGVDHRQYDDGNTENRLVVIWQPDNDVFGRQTSILSMSKIVSVKPAPRTIRVGGSENGFDIEIMGDVILQGALGYKASAWMNKLGALGVQTPGETGDLKELKGLRAIISEMTYNESRGKTAKTSEKPFWMPIEILSTAKKGNPEPDEPEHVETLEEVIMGVAAGKTEKDIVAWYEASTYYNGASAVPLFKAIAALRDAGRLKVQGGFFVDGDAAEVTPTPTSTSTPTPTPTPAGGPVTPAGPVTPPATQATPAPPPPPAEGAALGVPAGNVAVADDLDKELPDLDADGDVRDDLSPPPSGPGTPAAGKGKQKGLITPQ